MPTPSGAAHISKAGYWQDQDGDAVMVRQFYDSGWNSNGVSVDFIDGSTGAVSNAYSLEVDTSHPAPVIHASDIASGYLYALICHDNSHCAETAGSGIDGWIHKISLSGFGTAVKDTGGFATYTSTKLNYVAMGDSFSSGEGVPPFLAGTDKTNYNVCHRSAGAYPELLEKSTSLNLNMTGFVACSGATTNDVLGIAESEDPKGKWGEQKQIDSLSDDTDVVTITIGGNDVGFRDFAVACSLVCNFATTAYSDIHGKIVNDLPGKLADVYEAIDDATSSTADIYVVGYPQIAPAQMPTGMNSACWPLNGGPDDPDPELNDGATAYAVVSELNSVIHDAVNDMNSTKFHFVDPNLPGSPFIGHDWCQQDRYFDIVTYNNINHSFHPDEDGQAAYETIVEGEIN